jgi:Zn finger protein HypA/HybF involved in hydrogenase expression
MNIALARIEEYFSEEDNDVKCPKCGEIAALGQWNLATEEFYGSGITPLTTEDLTGGDLTEAETCDYVCPYCKAESVGASIIVINKR